MERIAEIVLVTLPFTLNGLQLPTFRADISHVVVDVSVMDQDGRVLTGLRQSDFRVYDERTEQPLIGFASEERSLDIVLLFDISGSMRPSVEAVAAVANQALAELRPGDRVAVMVFNRSTRVILAFTSDMEVVRQGIRMVLDIPFGETTHLHQAVDDAARYFREDKGSQSRRAVVVITDNHGIRTRDEMSVVRNLWEADASLSALIVPDPGWGWRVSVVAVMAPPMVLRIRGVGKIVELTGGATIKVQKMAEAFPEMMRRLRSRYSLYCRAPEGKAGSFRNIRVELSPETQRRYPEARVRARRGYHLAPRN
jgi:VWFA-related protein